MFPTQRNYLSEVLVSLLLLLRTVSIIRTIVDNCYMLIKIISEG